MCIRDRHHSVVHRDHLIGHVTDATVTWNVIPGSYDRRHHTIPPPVDPPPGGQPPGDPPDTVALTQSSSDADPWGCLLYTSRCV